MQSPARAGFSAHAPYPEAVLQTVPPRTSAAGERSPSTSARLRPAPGRAHDVPDLRRDVLAQPARAAGRGIGARPRGGGLARDRRQRSASRTRCTAGCRAATSSPASRASRREAAPRSPQPMPPDCARALPPRARSASQPREGGAHGGAGAGVPGGRRGGGTALTAPVTTVEEQSQARPQARRSAQGGAARGAPASSQMGRSGTDPDRYRAAADRVRDAPLATGAGSRADHKPPRTRRPSEATAAPVPRSAGTGGARQVHRLTGCAGSARPRGRIARTSIRGAGGSRLR